MTARQRDRRERIIGGICLTALIILFAALAYGAWREHQPYAVLEHTVVCHAGHCQIVPTWTLR